MDERSGGAVRSHGCLAASQSFGLRRQASWLKVWRGGGWNFQRDGTSTQAESKPSFAEWRLRSLVTISQYQKQYQKKFERLNIIRDRAPAFLNSAFWNAGKHCVTWPFSSCLRGIFLRPFCILPFGYYLPFLMQKLDFGG